MPSNLSRLSALAMMCLALLAATPAVAHTGLVLRDPFAQVEQNTASVYLLIENHADDADSLISASSTQAERAIVMVESEHQGVDSIAEAPDGLAIGAYEQLVLAPRKTHVVLTGLRGKFQDGDTIELILTFASSGPVTLKVPVMSNRKIAPADVKTAFDIETHGHASEMATQTGMREPTAGSTLVMPTSGD